MESNWRYNIWELGLWGSEWGFAARIQDYVGGEAWLLGIPGNKIFAIALTVGPDQPPDIQFIGVSAFYFPHMIQNPVDPD